MALPMSDSLAQDLAADRLERAMATGDDALLIWAREYAKPVVDEMRRQRRELEDGERRRNYW